MVGWSGSGRFEDFERTVAQKLSIPEAKAARAGGSLLIDAEDPVALALRVVQMPGVGWVAAGYRFNGPNGYLKDLEMLARRYLTRARRFQVTARAEASEQTAGDMVLAGNSTILSAVRGAKIDEKNPQVKFRVSSLGNGGACGVEIRSGPGGAPTGGEWAACLVSGGGRSSAMAWMAALSGYSIRLVHAATDDSSLGQVAKLYSELSHRMDSTRLELIVVEGDGDPMERAGWWLRRNRGTAFAGWRPTGRRAADALAKKFPRLTYPLVLVQDDAIASTYSSLGLGRASKGSGMGAFEKGALGTKAKYSETKFGGVEADSNTVIDAIRKAKRPR